VAQSAEITPDNVKDIIEFKPALMKVIQDEDTAKMVMDDLYFPILVVLRNGPMTVKEIEEKYNEIAKNKKSDKTIYRYLKTLQDHDLIKAAGQRVVLGKTATETLFARSAYAIYLRNEHADFWEGEEGNRLSAVLANALSPILPNKKINNEKLLEFLRNLSLNRIDMLKNLLEQADEELLDGISDFDWRRFTAFYDLAGLFAVLLRNPTLIDELRSCFE
jgi:predicted transcriptional regulator